MYDEGDQIQIIGYKNYWFLHNPLNKHTLYFLLPDAIKLNFKIKYLMI